VCFIRYFSRKTIRISASEHARCINRSIDQQYFTMRIEILVLLFFKSPVFRLRSYSNALLTLVTSFKFV